MAKTGSLGSCSIDSIPFDVAADADFGEIITNFKNSLIATSGAPVLKQEKQTKNIDGVVLVTSGSDRLVLSDRADSGKALSIFYVSRQGDRVSFSGQFNIEKNQTMDSRTAIEFLPMSEINVTLKK